MRALLLVACSGAAPGSEAADAEVAKRVVLQNYPSIQTCYRQRLKVDPTVEGKVELTWTIHGGSATETSVVTDTVGDHELVTCMREAVETWSFPATIQGEVSWPFRFQPSK